DSLKYLLAREPAVEVVAVRQKTAFSRNVLDVPGEQVVLQQPRDDVLRCQALRNRDLVLDHLSFDDGLDHIPHARLLGEKIFARLEVGARLEREHAADEDQTMHVDHAFAREELGDVHDAGAARDADDLLLLQGTRRLQPGLANHDRSTDNDQDEDQRGEDGVADDDQRIARTPRRTRGQWHVIGLERGARAARRDAFGFQRGGKPVRPTGYG